MPPAECVRRYEEKGPFELIEGEIVAVRPSVPLPNIIAKRLPFALVPDVVAEVVSPTDRHTDITAKVRRYLDDGVQLVWVVNPQARVVTAHRAGSDHSLWLSGEAVLSGADVTPGFELPLPRLFG